MKQNGKRKSNWKRLLSVTLVCALLLAFMPTITVSAATGPVASSKATVLVPDTDSVKYSTIRVGGDYIFPDDWSGCVYIYTTEPVRFSPEIPGKVYDNLYFVGKVDGIDITLNGINVTMEGRNRIVNFETGPGDQQPAAENKLRLEGTNVLKNNQHPKSEYPHYSTRDIQIISIRNRAELSIYGPGSLYLSCFAPWEDKTNAFCIGSYANIKEICPGKINIMGGEIHNLAHKDNDDGGGGVIGGYFTEGINIFGGRIYGNVGSCVAPDGSDLVNNPGQITIDGDCFIRGEVREVVGTENVTFTKGVVTSPESQIVRGGSFTYTAAESDYLTGSLPMTIEKGAQLTLSHPFEMNKMLTNRGALVVDSSVKFHANTEDASAPGGQLYNHGNVVVNPDKELSFGDQSGGIGDAELYNFSSGVVENNGSMMCYPHNWIINLGKIRGNEPVGNPVYETQFYSLYNISSPSATYTQNAEADAAITVSPSKIKYLDYSNVGFKATAITQPEGVTNGLALKEVKDGTATAIELGKLWNGGKGFALLKDQSITFQMKLLASEPGEYGVTYSLVNLEDNSEITSSTLTYTVAEAPIETFSTLTGITINGKAIEPFNKSTLSYDTEIPEDATELVVTATMKNPAAGYTVKKPDNLTDGINVVTITCISQDKSSTTTYTVNVNKLKPIKGIKALYLGGVPCEDFNPREANSIVTISDSQIDLKFTYTLSNSSDRVLTDTLSSKRLRTGNNICVVKIGDSRGALKIQHVITVKVVKGGAIPGAQLSANTNLKSLTVNGVAAVLTNDPSKCINVVLTDSRTTAAIAAAAEDPYAALTYTASLSIRPGNNLTTITVNSSDQSRQIRYTLCIRFQTIENTPAPSTGATDSTALKSVTVGGVSATIPASGSIVVDVGRISEQPNIVVTTEDPNAAIQVKYLTSKLKTGNNMAQIIVQSSDKSKKVTYMLVYRVG